ncbi:amino acid adenylation domain-containing protein [Plantactinospora sp. CA-294935]|uniref:amino acid adenylation domain-containing protein n=1 Tax=Plantactinospora sp. CA-294935 TaxID=3240012 RepID=UPI003D8A3255
MTDRTAADSFADPMGPAPLGTRFALRAAQIPDAIAVADDVGAVTFGELHRRADALSQVLLAAGAGPERTVAVRVGRRRELLVALLAVVRSGAAFVPLEPGHPVRRQRQIVQDSRALLAVTEQPGEPGADLGLPVVPVTSRPARDLPRIRPPVVHPAQTAYVIYTSGSTGAPKGVVVSHAALAHYLDWAARRYLGGGPAVVQTSPAFDLTVTGLFAPLLAGDAVRLVAGDGPAALLAALRERPCGLLKVTPSHLDALDALPAGPVDRPPVVRTLVVGGEALHLRQTLPWLADTEVVNEYGPTEATVGCCVHRTTTRDPERVPIGAPVPYASAAVLVDGRRPAGQGEPAELLVGGAGLARGYLGRPGLTAERFVPDPRAPGGRRYRTGDLVSRDRDGLLHFHGRVDRQLRIRGHRVEPGEVEAVLRSAPGVRDVAVCGLPTAGRLRLVAYLVAEPGVALDRAALRARVAERLPEYCVPGRMVTLPVLPRTGNGKVDHARLVGTPTAALLGALLDQLASLPEADALAIVAGTARPAVRSDGTAGG